jgi:thymidine kinase
MGGRMPSRLGRLYVHVGPMFAGKTSALLRLHANALGLGLVPLVLSHASDVRYGQNCVVSHDGVKVPCRSVESLGDVNVNTCHVVFVDEGQFMPDLVAFCNRALDSGKVIHVFGLSSDYLLREFRSITELFIFANSIDWLTGVCSKCGADATTTARVTSDAGRIVIGSGQYEPRCAPCHTVPEAVTPE